MAEQWHHNRRQLEFTIMISYTTLLALALYQIIKPREVPVSFDVHWEDSPVFRFTFSIWDLLPVAVHFSYSPQTMMLEEEISISKKQS